MKKYQNFNGVNVAKHWHMAGEVFAISDCLVVTCDTCTIFDLEIFVIFVYHPCRISIYDY